MVAMDNTERGLGRKWRSRVSWGEDWIVCFQGEGYLKQLIAISPGL